MTQPIHFGTDGVRGPFGTPPLDHSTVFTLGYQLVRLLQENTEHPIIVLGGDTRESTPILGRWLAAGIHQAGGRIRNEGTIPTAAIAYLVGRESATAGLVISASHNPFADNGLKLIDHQGHKWTSEAEHRLEQLMEHGSTPEPTELEIPLDAVGMPHYLEYLGSTLEGPAPLEGLKVVLDAANGAASPIAAPLFRAHGAEVIALHDRPNGTNINRDCGSTHPDSLQKAVLEHGAMAGVAFDGDADRALLVDELGELRDGDAMLYLWALALAEKNELQPKAIVATSMSNLGLERALAQKGIAVKRCAVGDRAVVSTMKAEGIVLGGEQSGHILNGNLSTSGDGLLTALQLLAYIKRHNQPLSILLQDFQRFPQTLIGVPVRTKPPLQELPLVKRRAREIESELGSEGRLVLRYSGTEALCRIMIEGPTQAYIDSLAESLAQEIRSVIGQ